MRRRSGVSEVEFEQQLFLGGRVSDKDSFYKDYALIDPDSGFLAWFLRHEETLSAMEPKDTMIELVVGMGQFEYLKSCSELTQLSMKLGDTRKRLSANGLRESLKVLQGAEHE